MQQYEDYDNFEAFDRTTNGASLPLKSVEIDYAAQTGKQYHDSFEKCIAFYLDTYKNATTEKPVPSGIPANAYDLFNS